VALQPHVPWQFDASQDQPAPNDQAMEIEASAYAHETAALNEASIISVA
jgi:hypothetical protein